MLFVIFSLLVFNILSFSLIFATLIAMCLRAFLFGFILPGTFYFLGLIDYFLSHVREVFSHYLFKYFPWPFLCLFSFWHFSGGSDCKEPTYNAGHPGLIPGWGRSPGERNGYPLQDSCLENSMDNGAWLATVHGMQRDGQDWVTNTFTNTILSLAYS